MNNNVEKVLFRDLMTKDFLESDKKLWIAIGRKVEENKPLYFDLCKIGHLLMAGVTNSGKSICIHTILASLLLRNSCENLKLVLIDSKKVELEAYQNIPHLAMPILTEPREAVAGLKWVVDEIDKRKTLFNRMDISNFSDYEKIYDENTNLVKLPRIVIIADEYADLITQFDFEGKDALVRIVQGGAPVGIHLILSTVRPTINIIFGTLKAFISNRIAFRVAAEIDSKVIIDQAGAEQLKGRGDMLLKNEKTCIHLQGAYIDESEVDELCDCIKENHPTSYLVSLGELNKIKVMSPEKVEEDEELLYQISLFCIETGMTTVNSIQLNFGLGFNRTLAILKELEKRNILSPKIGVDKREVLVDVTKLKEIMDN